MPTFSNPTYTLSFSENQSYAIGTSSQVVVIDQTWNKHSDFEYYYGTAKILITSMAQLGILLYLEIYARTVTESGVIVENPWNKGWISIVWNLVGSISFTNTNNINIYSANVNVCKILSYRLRHIEGYKGSPNYVTVTIDAAQNTSSTYIDKKWDYQKFVYNNISFFAKTTTGGGYVTPIYLPIERLLSIVPEEWDYQDVPAGGETVSNDEYPIYKINDIDTRYALTPNTGILPSYASKKLKARSNYFLFNNENKLFLRNFQGISELNSGNEKTLQYSKVGNNHNKTYENNQQMNMILGNIRFNTQLTESDTIYDLYHYFNFKKDYWRSTDLLDINKNIPTYTNPIILYNNFGQDTEYKELTPENFQQNFFWIDEYTLFFYKQLYYIPKNWIVDVYNLHGGVLSNFNSSSNFWSQSTSDWALTSAFIRAGNNDTEWNFTSTISSNYELYHFNHNNTQEAHIQDLFHFSDEIDLSRQFQISHTASAPTTIFSTGYTSTEVRFNNAAQELPTLLTFKTSITFDVPYWLYNKNNFNLDYYGETTATGTYEDYLDSNGRINYYVSSTAAQFGAFTSIISLRGVLPKYNGWYQRSYLSDSDSRSITSRNGRDFIFYHSEGNPNWPGSAVAENFWGLEFATVDDQIGDTYTIFIYDPEYSTRTLKLKYNGYLGYDSGYLRNASFTWETSENQPISITLASQTWNAPRSYSFDIPTGTQYLTVQWTDTIWKTYTIQIYTSTPVNTHFDQTYYL